MAPVGPVVVQNPISKMKRPPPPGIQTNGVVATTPSPSPSASAKKPPPSAKQPTPNPGVERNITTSTVRPVNRVRRDTLTQLGRNSRNSTGLRSSSVVADPQGLEGGPRPYVVTDSYVLKRNAGKRPSLVVHLHPNHFRFDGQDSIFSYVSPMRMFLQHLKTRTIPHDILEYLVQANVPFYDGCLIVRVHDHKSTAKSQETARPTSSSNAPDPSSVHSRSQYLTPSPYVAFPKEGTVPTDETNPAEAEAIKEEAKEDKEKENSTLATHQDGQKSKTPARPKVYTLVLHPTSESLQRDLLIKATTPAGGDGRQTADGTNGVPPSTPMTLVPPTPTAATMPPPAKRQKKVKMELEPNNFAAAEGQILLATEAPLFLEPTKTLEEQIILLDAMAHPKHSGPPPQPKTRKRTVAEMAADEAAAAEQERYMLLLDERSGTTSAQNAGGTDSDAQNGATAFEPRFERFKVIADIKREHAEKKEQEKIKQQENDRRLQQQRLQQQQEQAQAAQKQQAEAAEKARREAAIRENHARQQSEAQRAAMAARAAAQAATPAAPPKQVSTPQNSAPTPHVHPQQNPIATNNMPNGGQVVPQQQPNAVQNAVMAGQAQARFPAQIQQQVVSAQSPIIRQGTPQNHSSPMVNNSVPMQQTSSAMAASPPRPSSVVQNPPMSVPMAHNMSARGSQQSHPSGTPRMPHSTPNMAHGTPISRPAMVATPRMTQASPPPNMMAQNSQMGQMMMMNNQNLAQQNPQLMAQFAAQRAMQQQQQQHLQQQQQHNMQGANLNGNMVAQMSPQQQQHMMQIMQQRQQFLAQQQQQQQQMQQQQGGMPTQQQLAQQYSQQLQNMQGNQMRQMTPQMQAQLQMARMQQQQQQQAAQQAAAQQQMGGNTMQRQVSGQMMNGNNANMQAMLQMQQQQQQAAQQQRQMSQQQQQQSPVQIQIHQTARNVFARMIQETTIKYGGRDQVPEEVVNQVKAQSIQQAHMIVKNTIAQRQAAQQNQLLMQQQQQAMQGMGGMMGPQM